MELLDFEIETNINFTNETNIATIYTCNGKIINKLDKFCELYPEHYKKTVEDSISKTYEIDKTLICFRKPYDCSHWTDEKKKKFVENVQRGKREKFK